MHSPFVCAWHNPDGPPCPRPAADESGYCFWHRATHRLTALWQPKPVIEGTHPPWAETLVEISVYVFSLSFLHRAFHHSLWLHSGVAPDNNVSVNPMYALLLLGMGLGFLGKVLSLTRRNVPAAWFVRTRHFCYTGLWALGLALLATVERGTWQEKAGLMLVLMPVLLMLHRLERQSSLASVGATVVGLGCIVAAGLSMYVFEVVYQLTGELDYLSTEVPQHFLTRYIAASWFLFIGLGYVAAALDAGVSLLWTGGRPMIDAFRRSGGGPLGPCSGRSQWRSSSTVRRIYCDSSPGRSSVASSSMWGRGYSGCRISSWSSGCTSGGRSGQGQRR